MARKKSFEYFYVTYLEPLFSVMLGIIHLVPMQKFFEKVTLFTLRYPHVRVHIKG